MHSFFNKIMHRVRARVNAVIPESLGCRVDDFLSFVSTEYNYNFRREQILLSLQLQRKLPRMLHIEGTNTCNAQCRFCAYPQMQRPKQNMSMQLFRRVIDEYVEMGGKYVNLTPIVGDPFVDPHLLERLADLYHRSQIKRIFFYTNAILVRPESLGSLMGFGDKLTIHVSLGGFDRKIYREVMGVDKFETVKENIEYLIREKKASNSSLEIAIAVRCARSARSGKFWQELVSCSKQGLVTIEPISQYDSWAGKIRSEDLREIGLRPKAMPRKRGACELLYMKPVVLADGKVNACACRDVEAELIVGDLERASLKEIWAGPGVDAIIARHERGDYPDVCRRCTLYTSIYNLRSSEILRPALNWDIESASLACATGER